MGAPNWSDKTIWTGDNLYILRGMNSESVDLIYLDPPFNSKTNYAAPIGSKAAGAAFKDTWSLSDLDVEWINLLDKKKHATLRRVLLAAMSASDKSYLVYMAVRLLEMQRILKTSGSIYLHCDTAMSHYLKLVMDAVFGKGNFKNEVVWKRTTAHNDPKRFGRISDRLLFYGKSGRSLFHPVMGELSPEQRKRYKYQDANGPYKAEQLTAPHYSPTRTVEWRGAYPGSNRQWRFGVKELERLYATGRILPRRDGIPRKDGLKQYLHESAGAPVQDIWTDLVLAPTAGERTSYPTQKPLALLDRVVEASSNSGDVVMDPFCGCATTCVAAEALGRQWVGIDISPKAAELVRTRMKKELGLFYRGAHRTDIPKRTDLGKLPHYRIHRKMLYGEQEGDCAGCRTHFQARHLEVDHIISRKKGGTDHIGNLQLLCGSCNRIKGDRGMEYLKARLQI